MFLLFNQHLDIVYYHRKNIHVYFQILYFDFLNENVNISL